MDIGIGLPATIPGIDRDSLLDSARRADRRGFASVGVMPLFGLAAAVLVIVLLKVLVH